MVYNAMKLFMEINPQLFDECSHDYTELQNSSEQRTQARKLKWDRLAEQAQRKQNGSTSQVIPPLTSTLGTKISSPMRIDEVDPITQDSQKRLDALRLQDDGNPTRDRRPRDHERQNSVGSSRSQR